MKSDIEIARSAKLQPISLVSQQIGISENYLHHYGQYIAKVDLSLLEKLSKEKDGKLVLVTAITPTPAGEGKTTTTVGLGQALGVLGKKSMICLREPSLGPVFGIKGGAAGGGKAQVLPMEDINLHFTGDLHAITAANNLLASLIDNHIYHGNKLGFDTIIWRRCLDMNDRALRSVKVRRTKKKDEFFDTGFDITAASEVMAVLCLASDLSDLKDRLGRMVVGYTSHGDVITALQLKAEGAMTVLLKHAMNPNLVQTTSNTPAFIHGGPFANIAHGCNSLVATRLALKLADVVVTEAGFASDLGAEKFLDIKCRVGGLSPSAVVLVATVRALKMHGGALKEDLKKEDVNALERGFSNLDKHIENLKGYGMPLVVAINMFSSDTDEEIELVVSHCESLGVAAVVSDVWGQGGKGGVLLAEHVLELISGRVGQLKRPYELSMGIKEKILNVVQQIYGGKDVKYDQKARESIAAIEKLGYGELPICIAKTQSSLSDDASLVGRPVGFTVAVTDARVSAGAGFVVVYCGSVMTMPGLGQVPSAEGIDIDSTGKVSGLF